MTIVRARWVLPIDRPPVQGGWIHFDDNRVVDLGAGVPPGHAEDLGDVAILPGLVNAHTHLELSWLAGRVPPADSMPEWIRRVIAERGGGPPGGEADEMAAAERAIIEARATGTVLVGDVSNTLITPRLLASNGIGGTVFYELLGFDVRDPAALVRGAWDRIDRQRLELTELAAPDAPPVLHSVVAHAPYSVARELFAAIADAKREPPLSVHVGESAEELEFLQTGSGPFRALLEDLGVWVRGWEPPRCGPVEYLVDLGYLGPDCLAVHGVHLDSTALETLREREAVIVTCPRSNEWVGTGMPPIAHFYASGVPVAIGTDSLTSVATLNMFDELAAMRRIAPEISAASLLESATRIGAEALGHGDRFGTITPGKRAALVAVRVPPRQKDVEEYLVGGVPAADIRPL